MHTEYNHITHTFVHILYFLSPLSPRQAVICSGHSWHRTHHRSSHINALFALMVADAGGWTDAAHTHGWHGQPPGAPLAKEDGRRAKKSPCQFTLVALGWCLILPKGFAVFSKDNPQNWQDDCIKMLLNYHFWETNIETLRGFWLPKTHSTEPPSLQSSDW